MMYRKVTCPHCGNETVVKSIKENQKCNWCRRLILVKFKRNRGKKIYCEVEPVYFD